MTNPLYLNYNGGAKGMVQNENNRHPKTDIGAGNIEETGCSYEGAVQSNGSMGSQFPQRDEELGQAEENHLIDFIYRDISRINSLVSQLFQGALTSFAVSKNSTNQDGSKLSAGFPLLSGDNTTSRTQTDGIQKTYTPHDYNLIDLLTNLEPILDCRPLSISDTGRLCILSGSMLIRDYRMIKQTAPILFDMQGVQDGISPGNKKQGREIAKSISSILKIVPMGVELEMNTFAGESIIGSAKPECFSDSIDDITRTFGASLPGKWSILAIIDATDESGRANSLSPMRKTMDDLSNLTRAMYYGSTDSYAMTPILIYRQLRIK